MRTYNIDENYVKQQYNNGKRAIDLAKELGCGVGTIYTYLNLKDQRNK